MILAIKGGIVLLSCSECIRHYSYGRCKDTDHDHDEEQ